MTVLTQQRPSAVPGPCLTDAPSAGRVISVLFAVSVALFLLGLLTLGL